MTYGSIPLLEVNDLSVAVPAARHQKLILNHVSFRLQPGERVGVVGESGSGKSTLAAAIQGFLPHDIKAPYSGSVQVAGVDMFRAKPAELKAARRRFVRRIPQDTLSALNPSMTVRRQMLEACASNESSVREMLDKCGISEPERLLGRFPHQLSGGQRQRVLIAMAMLARPKLIIADEPTTALDPQTRDSILDLLHNLSSEVGTAILLVTHDLAVAAAVTEKIIVLGSGRILEIGNTPSVIEKLKEAHADAGLRATYSHSRRPDGTSARSDRGREVQARDGVRLSDYPHTSKEEPRTVLTLRAVSKHFTHHSCFRKQKVSILSDVDIKLRQGECLAVTGESGVGKTTLLKIAAGALEPDAGTVEVVRGTAQFIPQDPVAALTPWLTVGEQISEGLDPKDRRERHRELTEWMTLVRLDPDLQASLPGELSVGQCQRAVIARALAAAPALLLLDEPISALDLSTASATVELLVNLRRLSKVAMLLVTHDAQAACAVADRVLSLESGCLRSIGDP